MRLNRSSLRIALGAVLALGLGTACGGGAAAPSATAQPTSSPAAVPAPSPPRPALASPVASPSTVASAPTPAATAGAQVAAETYEVQSGDTLLSIAQQYYSDPTQWRLIYDANKDTIGADPDKLQVGMKLTIPPKPS